MLYLSVSVLSYTSSIVAMRQHGATVSPIGFLLINQNYHLNLQTIIHDFLQAIRVPVHNIQLPPPPFPPRSPPRTRFLFATTAFMIIFYRYLCISTSSTSPRSLT